MKRNLFKLFGLLLFSGLLMLTSCNQSKKEVTPAQEVVGYNYDNCVKGDYAHMQGMYDSNFVFLEADVVFDSLVNESIDSKVIQIRTVFQAGDTCVMFHHWIGMEDSLPVITKEHGYFLECNPLDINCPINLDSCMTIAAPYRKDLPTRKLTFRRIVGPPFPLHGEYIFGNGMLFIDSKNAHLRGNIIDNGLEGYYKVTE